MTQTPKNTCITCQGTTVTSAPTASGAETAIIATQIPPVYIATHYGGTLTSPMGTVETAISKIAPAAQQKNKIDFFNFINTQGSDIQDLNGDYTLLLALLSAPGNQQVKVFRGMGIVTTRITNSLQCMDKEVSPSAPLRH